MEALCHYLPTTEALKFACEFGKKRLFSLTTIATICRSNIDLGSTKDTPTRETLSKDFRCFFFVAKCHAVRFETVRDVFNLALTGVSGHLTLAGGGGAKNAPTPV